MNTVYVLKNEYLISDDIHGPSFNLPNTMTAKEYNALQEDLKGFYVGAVKPEKEPEEKYWRGRPDVERAVTLRAMTTTTSRKTRKIINL